MVAGWRMGVLVACRAWCHLVVALGAGAGLVGALRGWGSIGGELVCVVPAKTKGEEGTGQGRWGRGGSSSAEGMGGHWLGLAPSDSHGWCPWRLWVVLWVDLWG